MTATFAALLSLATAVTVAIISHLLAERRSRSADLAALRLTAYGDFIQAVSRLISVRRLGKTFCELEELSALNDAKARICICAETPVVEALTKFWKEGGRLRGRAKFWHSLACANECGRAWAIDDTT